MPLLDAGLERERPGGAWPLNLENYLASDRSADAFWSTSLRSPALASLLEMRVSASTTAKIVATQWHCHRPVPAYDLQGFFRKGPRDALIGQHFQHLIGTRPEPRFHRFLHDLDESVATGQVPLVGVACLDRRGSPALVGIHHCEVLSHTKLSSP